MIYDFTKILLQLSSAYTWITTTAYVHQGIQYSQPGTEKIIHGVMVPLTSEERIELQGLGHSIEGKMDFFVPTSEGHPQENDIILDSRGTEWIIEPYDADYTDVGNVIQYRLERKVLK